jgi:hypothetical protein
VAVEKATRTPGIEGRIGIPGARLKPRASNMAGSPGIGDRTGCPERDTGRVASHEKLAPEQSE